jgi:hypothetical protein
MTQNPGNVLPLLLTMGVIIRSTRRTFSVTFHDAKEASSAKDRRVADWIKGFESAPRSETNEVSEAQVEALFDAMEAVCHVGGSTGRSMKHTFTQGLADLGGRDGVEMETAPMVFAVATLLELVLAKANLNEVSSLAVLGRVVARELNKRKWRESLGSRSATFHAAVAKLLDEGCGFGNDDWFQNGEEEARAQEDAGDVPNLYSGDVERGLALELEAKTVDERDAAAEMERRAQDLLDARSAHTDAANEAREAAEMRLEVQNELWVVRQKRRLDRFEAE